MAAFELHIDTDNAAFQDSGGPEEVARILAHVAEKVAEGYTTGPALDINGNTVGSWTWTA